MFDVKHFNLAKQEKETKTVENKKADTIYYGLVPAVITKIKFILTIIICSIYNRYVAISRPATGGGVSDGKFISIFHGVCYGKCRFVLHL